MRRKFTKDEYEAKFPEFLAHFEAVSGGAPEVIVTRFFIGGKESTYLEADTVKIELSRRIFIKHI